MRNFHVMRPLQMFASVNQMRMMHNKNANASLMQNYVASFCLLQSCFDLPYDATKRFARSFCSSKVNHTQQVCNNFAYTKQVVQLFLQYLYQKQQNFTCLNY